jgi:F0F1-type ATP synthase assembly protein I
VAGARFALTGLTVLKRVPAAVSLLGIGWYFAASIVGGIVGGLLLDGWLDTKPLFTLLGLLAGLLLAFWGGYRLLVQVISGRGQEEDQHSA